MEYYKGYVGVKTIAYIGRVYDWGYIGLERREGWIFKA